MRDPRPWLVLLMLTACSGSSGKPAAQCRREAEALVTSLRAVDSGPASLWVPPDVELVARPELSKDLPANAPTLVLGVGALRLQGLPVEAYELRERLLALRAQALDAAARHPERAGPTPDTVVLVIDRRARWSRIVDVWQIARAAGLRAPVLVFGAPVTVTPPPRAPIDDALDAILRSDSGQRATELAALVKREVEPCPALVRLFGAIASDTSTSKSKTLLDGMAPALIECRCRVNLANLHSVFWHILADTHPVTTLALAPTAPTTVIALPATATWADAAARFTPGLGNAELRVE